MGASPRERGFCSRDERTLAPCAAAAGKPLCAPSSSGLRGGVSKGLRHLLGEREFGFYVGLICIWDCIIIRGEFKMDGLFHPVVPAWRLAL